MLPAPRTPSPPRSPLSRRIVEGGAAITEIFIVAFLGSVLAQGLLVVVGLDPMANARHLAIFMWTEAVFTLVAISVLLRVRNERWAHLGWTASGFQHELRIGLAVLPGLFVITYLTGGLFQTFWPEYVSPANPLLEMIKTGEDLVFFLISSIFVGGLKEEVQRAFVLRHFERYLGGIWVGLVVWTVVFAALHAVQGFDKAVAAGLLGFVFGLLYIWRRNLTSPIVSHALYDVTTLLIFWRLLRQV